LALLITCRFLLVHPQLNYIDSFHSEAKICNIKYNLEKKVCSFVFRKAALKFKGANTHGKKRERAKQKDDKQKILGKLVNY